MRFHSHAHSHDDDQHTSHRHGGPGRRWRRRGGRHGGGPRSGRGHGRRHRARRGALRDGILVLLGERPMHGYELITELETRSEGRWRPSPGAIYPALRKLEYHGLITTTATDESTATDPERSEPTERPSDARTFELTDEGRGVLAGIEAARAAGGPAPWDDTGSSEQGELRQLMAEIGGQLRQVGRFGSEEQLAQVRTILTDTRTKLYDVLASGERDDADRPTDGPADRPTNGSSDW